MELNYKFIGNPASSNLIVFLHEGLGSIAQWKEYPELLCEATNSYGLVYDRAGYGKSKGSLVNRTATYLHEAAHELSLLLEHIQPNVENIYLYGHSDGGSIALIYAADFENKKLKGIITEAAHVFVEQETIDGVRKAIQPFKEGKLKGLEKYHGDRYKEVFLAWNNIWLTPLFAHWNIESKLERITCPQLIIQGINDQYGTLKQVESIANNTKGRSEKYTPENCGHAPHKEKQKDTLLKASKFINESN